MAEPARYTLQEARELLAKAECARFGHTWDVLRTLGGGPSRIACGRCRESHSVCPDPDAHEPPTET